MRVALFEKPDGRRGIGIVREDHVVDLSDWVGTVCCPLAAFLARAAQDPVPLTGERYSLATLVWLPPPLGASSPLCVGVNYSDHATELRAKSAVMGHANPALFTRYWSSGRRSVLGDAMEESVVFPSLQIWLRHVHPTSPTTTSTLPPAAMAG